MAEPIEGTLEWMKSYLKNMLEVCDNPDVIPSGGHTDFSTQQVFACFHFFQIKLSTTLDRNDQQRSKHQFLSFELGSMGARHADSCSFEILWNFTENARRDERKANAAYRRAARLYSDNHSKANAFPLPREPASKTFVVEGVTIRYQKSDGTEEEGEERFLLRRDGSGWWKLWPTTRQLFLSLYCGLVDFGLRTKQPFQSEYLSIYCYTNAKVVMGAILVKTEDVLSIQDTIDNNGILQQPAQRRPAQATSITGITGQFQSVTFTGNPEIHLPGAAILTLDPDCLKKLFDKEKESNQTVAGYADGGFEPPTVLECTSLFSVRDKILNSFAPRNDGSDFVVAVKDQANGLRALCFFESNTFLNDPSKGSPKDVLDLKGFLEEAGFQSIVQLQVVREYNDEDDESIADDEASIYLFTKEPGYFDLNDLLKTLAEVPEKILEQEWVGRLELTITNEDRNKHEEWRRPLAVGVGAVASVARAFSAVNLAHFNIQVELQMEVGSGKGSYVFTQCGFAEGGRFFFFYEPLSSNLVFEESFPDAVAIQQVATEKPQYLQGTGKLILQYGKVSPQQFEVFQALKGQFGNNLELHTSFREARTE